MKCRKMKIARAKPGKLLFFIVKCGICDFLVMVGEMVQNLQRLYSFTFNAIIIIIIIIIIIKITISSIVIGLKKLLFPTNSLAKL